MTYELGKRVRVFVFGTGVWANAGAGKFVVYVCVWKCMMHKLMVEGNHERVMMYKGEVSIYVCLCLVCGLRLLASVCTCVYACKCGVDLLQQLQDEAGRGAEEAAERMPLRKYVVDTVSNSSEKSIATCCLCAFFSWFPTWTKYLTCAQHSHSM